MSNRCSQVRQTEESENNNDNGGWHRNQKGESAGVFRSEQIEQPNNEDGRRREFFRVRHAEILKGGKRADGRSDQVIGDEQKRTDNRNNFAAMSHACINAA